MLMLKRQNRSAIRTESKIKRLRRIISDEIEHSLDSDDFLLYTPQKGTAIKKIVETVRQETDEVKREKECMWSGVLAERSQKTVGVRKGQKFKESSSNTQLPKSLNSHRIYKSMQKIPPTTTQTEIQSPSSSYVKAPSSGQRTCNTSINRKVNNFLSSIDVDLERKYVEMSIGKDNWQNQLKHIDVDDAARLKKSTQNLKSEEEEVLLETVVMVAKLNEFNTEDLTDLIGNQVSGHGTPILKACKDKENTLWSDYADATRGDNFMSLYHKQMGDIPEDARIVSVQAHSPQSNKQLVNLTAEWKDLPGLFTLRHPPVEEFLRWRIFSLQTINGKNLNIPGMSRQCQTCLDNRQNAQQVPNVERFLEIPHVLASMKTSSSYTCSCERRVVSTDIQDLMIDGWMLSVVDLAKSLSVNPLQFVQTRYRFGWFLFSDTQLDNLLL